MPCDLSVLGQLLIRFEDHHLRRVAAVFSHAQLLTATYQSDITLIGGRSGRTPMAQEASHARTRWQRCSERPARVVGISPAPRHPPPDQPLGVPPPPLLWGHAVCRWQRRGLRGRRVPLLRRLRMGSVLPGPGGAESRGWLLVPHHRSLRICPNLSQSYPRGGETTYSTGQLWT